MRRGGWFQPEMQDGVGLARRIEGVAPEGAESHPFVKSHRLGILFVDVDGAASQRAESVGQQACAEVVSAPSGLYEEHFDVASVDAQECQNPVAGKVRAGICGWGCWQHFCSG